MAAAFQRDELVIVESALADFAGDVVVLVVAVFLLVELFLHSFGHLDVRLLHLPSLL
jgi:hypothetical protein